MLISESYAELATQAYSRSQQDGNRPYPVACYEIFMMAQAQQRAERRESELFSQFGDMFDWDIPRRQRNLYLKRLQTGFTLVLTDPTKKILWTSQKFLAMTGYTRSEIVGKTSKILQGPDTDLDALSKIRESLRRADSVRTNLLNYRKNGEPYVCHLSIDPLFNTRGELTHFLAVENEVTT